MITKATRIRVGAFVAITAVLFVIVLVAFARLRFWQHRDRYRIVFEDTVYGLELGAHVYLNGMRVGTVEGIDVGQNLREIEVVIEVDEGAPIRTNTRATLQYAGITGLKEIDLRGGSRDAPPLPPGGTILPGETLLDRLEDQVATIAEQSAELMTRANRIVGKLEGLDEVVASARTTADNLAQTSAALRELIGESRGQLRRSLAAIEATARGASKLLDDQLSRLATNANELVTDVKGAVRRNDAALQGALSDLRQASRTFKELARELRQRPSRLLYSKPPKERKLP